MWAMSNIHAGRRFPTPALEGLMDFLAFMVPKLWSKYCKLIREIPANPRKSMLESRSRTLKTCIIA